MNRISPKKLLNSKWTAVHPRRKEKHFLVNEVDYDEQGTVIFCSLEAVISKRIKPIQWQQLKDREQWLTGWQ